MLTDDNYVRLEAREREKGFDGKYTVRGMAMVVRLKDWKLHREFIDYSFHERGFWYILRTKLAPDSDPTKSMAFSEGDVLPWERGGQWESNHYILYHRQNRS